VPESVKRILLVEANEDHTVGGSHQALFDLVRSLQRSAYEPIVCFYQANIFAERLRGIAEVIIYDDVRRDEVRTIRDSGVVGKVIGQARAVARRRSLLRRLRIDLVHLNNSPRVGNDDWLPAARLAGVPCIANAMGDADGESHPLRRRLFRAFDHVLPISDYMEAAMIRAGIPAGRMTMVKLGVDADRARAQVSSDRATVRRDLGVRDDVVLAVMVGNIRSWKGQHVVLEALRLLAPADRSKLHVVFVGATSSESAEYERQLRAFVLEHDLSNTVSFLGSRTDVPDLFSAADLALHASIMPEPFGLVVVEALALGVAVIAANTGGPAEVITEDCGVVYDPTHPAELAEILADLVRDEARRSRLRAGAPARAAEFSVKSYVSGIEAVYAYCCAHRPRIFRRIPPRTGVPPWQAGGSRPSATMRHGVRT
jgi:glycosyltransferase involved in cell wall biosynthesis